MRRRKLVVGSRGSKLALIQAGSVVVKLREINPQLEVDICKILTKGDRNLRIPIDPMEGVGVFVRELELALLDGRIDVAVHSLKDMPSKIPQSLCLAAVTQRLNPGDVLVSKSRKIDDLAPGSRIGTASFRRTVQLTSYRPDLEICGIKGNIDTRIRKVFRGEIDGVILAAAAMTRLGWEDKITEFLPVDHFLPAVGQGALAIETRCADEEIAELIISLNHLPTWQSITAERALIRTLGGGCRAPIAALGTVDGVRLKLKGMIADSGGKKILRDSEEGNTTAAEEVGMRLAEKLLELGASEFIAEGKVR